MNAGRTKHAQVEPGEKRRGALGGYLEPLMNRTREQQACERIAAKGSGLFEKRNEWDGPTQANGGNR